MRDAATTYYECKCPFCGGPILPPRSTKEANPFGRLLAAWRAFEEAKGEVDVEFVIKTEPAT